MQRKRDIEEEAFDAALRRIELPEPPASLRDRCLPPYRACRVLAVDESKHRAEILHDLRPQGARGSQLRDFHEEIHANAEKE